MSGVLKLHLLKLVLFGILSLADLLLTWQLLRDGDGHVYESNPVANAWLAYYGWIGLIVFKVTMVFLVAGLAIFIAMYRPRTSGIILIFACSVTAVVVAYSCYLTKHYGNGSADLDADEFVADQDLIAWEAIAARRTIPNQAFLDNLCRDLTERRLTLAAAVNKMAGWEKRNNPWHQAGYRASGHDQQDEARALTLIAHFRHRFTDSPGELKAGALKALELDFQQQFGETVASGAAKEAANRNTLLAGNQP